MKYIYKNHVDCVRDSTKLPQIEINKYLRKYVCIVRDRMKPQIFTTASCLYIDYIYQIDYNTTLSLYEINESLYKICVYHIRDKIRSSSFEMDRNVRTM